MNDKTIKQRLAEIEAEIDREEGARKQSSAQKQQEINAEYDRRVAIYKQQYINANSLSNKKTKSNIVPKENIESKPTHQHWLLKDDVGFEIVGRKEENGFIAIEHGGNYKLQLWNYNANLRCDAEVKIDGKSVGKFRVDKIDSIIIERPVNDRGCFTFYAAETIEAKTVMLDSFDKNKLGLIEVIFYPEKSPSLRKEYNRDVDVDIEIESLQCKSWHDPGIVSAKCEHSIGGTGLSGYSSTEYYDVDALDYDYDNIATVYLRLILKKPTPSCLNSIQTPIESDADLSDWITKQQKELEKQQKELEKQQALLQESIEKNKLLRANQEVTDWVEEQKKALAEYRKTIDSMGTEKTIDDEIDYWH